MKDITKPAAAAGNFEALFSKNYPIVLKYLRSRVSDPQTAEDLAMDAFTACYNNFDSYDPEKAEFRTWLFVIVKNKLKNHYRGQRETLDIDDYTGEETVFENDLAEATHISVLRDCLSDALETLSYDSRQIVIYKYFSGMKSEEIASVLGTTPGNVRVKLTRALEKLRKYFNDNNIRWE